MPDETPEEKAQRKSMLLQAAAQLDMLTVAFDNAPRRVKDAAVEFKAALTEWADA